MNSREELLSDQREIVAAHVSVAIKRAQREGKQLVYENQQEAVNEIMRHFIEGKRCVMVVAPPGAGKTGVAQGSMIHCAQHSTPEQAVLTKDMFLCTGMSDTEWKEQFESNLIEPFRANVVHRATIACLEPELKTTRESLIIEDECHIANGPNMVVGRTLRAAGLMDMDQLEQRNIRLVKISATPEAVAEDLRKWGSKGAMVVLRTGAIYKGFQTMVDDNRILNSPALDTRGDVEHLFNRLEDRYRNTAPKYFIFRVTQSDARGFLENVAIQKDWIYRCHDSIDRYSGIDKEMKDPPRRHTVIVIKEFWRASKRLVRDHVGATYEPITKVRNATVTSQGLTARFCDNFNYSGDWLNPDLRPLHFCDMESIRQYMSWVNGGYAYHQTEIYQGGTIKARDGVVRARPTMIHHDNVENLDVVELPVLPPPCSHRLSDVFDTQDEAKTWSSVRMNAPASKCGLFDENKNIKVPHRATHYADYIGDARHHALILTSAVEEGRIVVGDVERIRRGVHTGGKSRIMPVRIDNIVKFVVVYKPEHLKPNMASDTA